MQLIKLFSYSVQSKKRWSLTLTNIYRNVSKTELVWYSDTHCNLHLLYRIKSVGVNQFWCNLHQSWWKLRKNISLFNLFGCNLHKEHLQFLGLSSNRLNLMFFLVCILLKAPANWTSLKLDLKLFWDTTFFCIALFFNTFDISKLLLWCVFSNQMIKWLW